MSRDPSDPQEPPPDPPDPDASSTERPAEDVPSHGVPEPVEPEVLKDRPTPVTQQIGRVVVVALAVLFGVFAVANSHHVDFFWVFGGTEVVRDADGERTAGGVPLIVLLVVSLVIGALIGAAAAWQARRSRERRARREADGPD